MQTDNWVKVNFKSGPLLLEGLLLDPGALEVTTAVVVCHPHPLYGGDMWNDIVSGVANALGALDVPVLRFNFRGVGESEGEHDGVSEVGDVRAAVDFLFQRFPGLKSVCLAGYSWGLVMALAESDGDDRVSAVAGIAPPVGFMDCGGAGTGSIAVKLFIVGDRDRFMPMAKFEDWLMGVGGEVRVEILKGADHFFFGRTKSISTTVAEFLKNTIR